MQHAQGDVGAQEKFHGNVQLDLLPSNFGLPTFDPDCLAVLAYSRFGNAKVEVKTNCCNSIGFQSATDRFPRLNIGNERIATVESILNKLREMNCGIDYQLNKKECADSVAFINMMDTKLRPALMHMYWLEEGNLSHKMRSLYSSAMPFPGSIFYIRSLTHQSHQLVYTASAGDMEYMTKEQVDKRVYRDAVMCLTYLSDKLGSKAFLFGKNPTTADAIMFGYLSPILRVNFPHNRLKGHLEGHENLCNTVTHILRRYFTETISEATVTAGSDLGELDKDFPHKARNSFIFTVFCLTVVVTYALLRGTISIDVSDIDDDLE